MDNLAADFEINPNNPLNAEYELGEGVGFDCSFELFASGTVWGNIDGDINNQTDLINLFNTKVDLTDFEELSQTVTNNYNELSGEIANLTITVTDNYNTLSGQISDLTSTVNNNHTSLDNRLTTAEGSILDLTDTVNDNYTELDGKITTTNNNLSTLSQTVEDNNTAINNRVDGIVDSFDGDISDLNDAIDNLSDTVADNYTDLDGKITNLNGTVSNNYTELNGKITDNTDDITAIQNTINSYGDIVSYNAAYFATANQGALADTSLQPNDNITLLNNNAGYITGIDNSDVVTALGYTPYNASNPAGYITAASLPTVNNNTITIQKNGVNVDSFTLNQNSNKSINITVPTNNNELTNGAGYITSADIPTLADLTTTAQLEAINSGATSTKIGQIATNTQNIADEVTNRQNADNGLQSQIDAIVSSSDVFDIVGTYAELQAYDISTVPVNDIIKVLVDSTHSNAATYYRCVESGSVKTWSYIGSEGAYYTKSEADGRFVAQTITVNGQPLSSNVTLTASDVGALPDSTVIPTVNNSTITIQKNSTTVDTFTLNQSSAKTINISVPTDTNDLTNGAGYITGITSGDVTTALGYTPYNSSNPNGYISGITSSDVTTALGYTPYNSTNPSGYITSSALTNYVTTNTAQNISGRKTFLGEKAIYFKQNATSDKLGFTLYNPSNAELGALEYRPNTINGNALLALNCPQATGGYVGFRYWGSPAVNIVAPKVATAGNYYISTHITDGTNTVTADSTGKVNISTLLPDVSNFVTNSSLATTLADYVTNANLTTILSDYALTSSLSTVATSGSYNDLTNKPTIPDISNLANKDLSNLSSTGESKFQAPLVSGTNIKTINNTSLLGSGDIDTTEIFVAEYDVTSYADVLAAYNAGKTIYVKYTGDGVIPEPIGYYSFVEYDNQIPPESFKFSRTHGTLIENVIVSYSLINQGSTIWNMTSTTAANTTLSNVSSIDSNSAVQTALDGKADTSLSNLSATGKTVIDGQVVSSLQTILSNGTSLNGSTNLTKRIDVPNDGHIYEVIIRGGVSTGSTSGNAVSLNVYGNQDSYSRGICTCRTRTASSVNAAGSCIVYVSYVATDATNITIERKTSYNGTIDSLQTVSYRRVGTNS